MGNDSSKKTEESDIVNRVRTNHGSVVTKVRRKSMSYTRDSPTSCVEYESQSLRIQTAGGRGTKGRSISPLDARLAAIKRLAGGTRSQDRQGGDLGTAASCNSQNRGRIKNDSRGRLNHDTRGNKTTKYTSIVDRSRSPRESSFAAFERLRENAEATRSRYSQRGDAGTVANCNCENCVRTNHDSRGSQTAKCTSIGDRSRSGRESSFAALERLREIAEATRSHYSQRDDPGTVAYCNCEKCARTNHDSRGSQTAKCTSIGDRSRSTREASSAAIERLREYTEATRSQYSQRGDAGTVAYCNCGNCVRTNHDSRGSQTAKCTSIGDRSRSARESSFAALERLREIAEAARSHCSQRDDAGAVANCNCENCVRTNHDSRGSQTAKCTSIGDRSRSTREASFDAIDRLRKIADAIGSQDGQRDDHGKAASCSQRTNKE